MTQQNQENRQDGIPIGSGAADGEVAHGSRRDEAHFEPRSDRVAVARFTEKPAGPLPPEEHSAQSDAGAGVSQVPPIEDVRVVKPGPSVWDARPPEDDEPRSGNPTGH
jgi:hypothetical protein